MAPPSDGVRRRDGGSLRDRKPCPKGGSRGSVPDAVPIHRRRGESDDAVTPDRRSLGLLHGRAGKALRVSRDGDAKFCVDGVRHAVGGDRRKGRFEVGREGSHRCDDLRPQSNQGQPTSQKGPGRARDVSRMNGLPSPRGSQLVRARPRPGVSTGVASRRLRRARVDAGPCSASMLPLGCASGRLLRRGAIPTSLAPPVKRGANDPKSPRARALASGVASVLHAWRARVGYVGPGTSRPSGSPSTDARRAPRPSCTSGSSRPSTRRSSSSWGPWVKPWSGKGPRPARGPTCP